MGDRFGIDGSFVLDGLHLFPALDNSHLQEVEELLHGAVPDLIKQIKEINSLLNRIVDIEDEKRFISDSFDEFINRAKKYYDDIINGIDGNIGKKEFVRYINLLFLLLNLRKVYNTSPKEGFRDFSELDSHSQLLRLVVPKGADHQFFHETTGGSCHNYSIIFKNFFDYLGINANIIFCNPVSNHSFVLAEIFGEYYIVDPLFNIKGFIEKVEIGSQIQVGFNHFGNIKSFVPEFFVDYFHVGNDQYKSGSLKLFDNLSAFVCALDNRKIKYIIFEYFSPLDNSIFRIEIGNETEDNLFLSISFGDNELTYNYKMRKVLDIYKGLDIDNLSNTEIISILIRKLYQIKGKKQSISLEDILEKISSFSEMIKRDDLLKLLNLKIGKVN